MGWRRAAWVLTAVTGMTTFVLAVAPFSITVPRGFGGPGPYGPDSVVTHCPSPLGVTSHPDRVDVECKEPGRHRIYWALGLVVADFFFTALLFVTRRVSWAETWFAGWLRAGAPHRRAATLIVALVVLIVLALVLKNAAEVPKRLFFDL